MPGWLPPARQNFLLFQCIGNAVNFHHVWATPGIKGGGGVVLLVVHFHFKSSPVKQRGGPCAAPGFHVFLTGRPDSPGQWPGAPRQN